AGSCATCARPSAARSSRASAARAGCTRSISTRSRPTSASSCKARVAGLALLAAAYAGGGLAQKIPVIAYVANANADAERMGAYKRGVTELGYVEGKTRGSEYRRAKLAREYDAWTEAGVPGKGALTVASNAPAATAAAKATRTIPIVLAGVNDPVGL